MSDSLGQSPPLSVAGHDKEVEPIKSQMSDQSENSLLPAVPTSQTSDVDPSTSVNSQLTPDGSNNAEQSLSLNRDTTKPVKFGLKMSIKKK